MDIPLMWGVIGLLLAPQLPVIGAMVILLKHGSIVVDKTEVWQLVRPPVVPSFSSSSKRPVRKSVKKT